jgi:hypothetical protein
MHSDYGRSIGSTWLLRAVVLAFVLISPTYAQSSLTGATDFHVHSSPDSVSRIVDADDLARHAKELGMRGLVLKNHYESTAALAYMVRKEVPGIEIFGGITQDRAAGGINLEALKHMVAMKGGWGRVVWLPTFDSEAQVKYDKSNLPFVAVSRDGKLLPEELEVIDFIAQHPEMVLETGHVSAEEALMVVHEAHRRGVKHIVITHGMRPPTAMNISQMQEAARDGAFIEFVYQSTLGTKPLNTIAQYAEAIRQVGAKSCILSTDFGGGRAPTPDRPLHPEALLMFMDAMVKAGISQADVDMMTKTNPALALGLQ